jgi:16S rRNA (cytosine967-C5)-methyltransferase
MGSAGPVSIPRPIPGGRVLAWAALQEFDRTDRFLQDIFADLDAQHRLSSADRALAVDLAAGVVRRLRTLDTLIASQLTRSRDNVEADLWRVLRLGTQQLVFARTPDHAAVSETVELCRLLGRDRWTGFVNGVLRNIARQLTDKECNAPASNAVPLGPSRYRVLSTPVFADPMRAWPEYIAEAFSLRNDLAQRWCRRLTADEVLAAAARSVTAPETVLRVNTLRATRERVIQAMQAAGVVCEAGGRDGSITLLGAGRLESLPGFSDGWWSVQDEAAQAASVLLAPQSGEQILDLCAAPGGKTTHLAELSHDAARIVACDVALNRLDRVRENAARLQLTSIETRLIDRNGDGLPAGPFDAALVDVPCSNTGVLNRRPEARWRFRPEDVVELAELQLRLLTEAGHRVRGGGRVVYSTCSLEPEENREVVDRFLAANPDWKLIADRLHLPGRPADGAYQALLHRD